MALLQCSECNHEVSEQAQVCPHCGCPVAKTPKKTSILTWVLGVPLVVIFLLFTYGWLESQSPEAQTKQRARDVIAICWEDQARKSLDPATARFVASTCEGLEKQFKEKYGRNP